MTFLLFLVVFAALHFRYYRLHAQFKPALIYDISLWVSVISIVAVGALGIIKIIN